MLKTLSGLKIADFSMFVAGPFATSILADLGAEVIKIEPISGDPLRANKAVSYTHLTLPTKRIV